MDSSAVAPIEPSEQDFAVAEKLQMGSSSLTDIFFFNLSVPSRGRLRRWHSPLPCIEWFEALFWGLVVWADREATRGAYLVLL